MEVDFDIQIYRNGNWVHFSVETLNIVPIIGHNIELQGRVYHILDVIIRTGSQNHIIRIQ